MKGLAGHVVAALLLMGASQAADIQGTVVVERKLTKRNVTPTTGLYQRGAAVDLGADATKDPLDYERSHVVVYLEGSSAFEGTRKTPAIEQRERRFSPDLVVIPAGGSITFPNFDPIFHNVFSLSKAKSFDLGNYSKGQTRTVAFPKPGVVFVYCHLHPNMSAAVVVAPNAWSTIADAAGKFTLPDVPPGNYTVAAWHKTAGTFRQKVTVGEGTNNVTFFVPLPAEPPTQVSRHHH
ncbi:MAG: carboxypeptidase regulatory-like domain-containing protein [Acidobacteriota bacterium]